MNLKKLIEEDGLLVENWISEYMDKLGDNSPKTIREAMNYSLKAGGKRLRPILLMEAYKLFGSSTEEVKGYAFALEAIHTYSLIHDDLPAMDNDDYRRGKPTNHKVFGEAMAILAGDALLNYGMEVLISEIKNEKTLAASRLIAGSAGPEGMIGGQVMDIEAENTLVDYETLKKLHEMKTGRLIGAALLSGAILGGAKEDTIEYLRTYAYEIGLAFQITDDILDVEGSLEELGKTVGSDEQNHKTTYVSLFGLEKAKTLAKVSVDNGISAIKNIPQSEFFVEFGNYILSRKS